MAHKFDPRKRELLDRPERREWQDPATILDFFGIGEGATVADVGCGTGFFSIPASRMVGPEGRVYAVDMQEEMLWSLQERLVEKKIDNVLPILSTEDSIPLPESRVDATLLVNALHELTGDGTLKEIHRILKSGGYLAVVDWAKKPMEVGPPLSHRLSLDEAVTRLRSAGFGAEVVEIGDLHYGIKATK